MGVKTSLKDHRGIGREIPLERTRVVLTINGGFLRK
jgi:hypothetical protein